MTTLVLGFWGITAGNILVAIVLAAILDGRKWISLKWDFDEAAYVKAFQFCLLLVAVVVGLSWVEDEGRSGALNVVQWLPVLLFPMEFVQRYGARDRVNLNLFFYFSRRRMAQDRKEGREVHPKQINTGYPYVLGILAASSTIEELPEYFWALLSFMVMVVIATVYRQRGLRLRGMLLVMPVVIALGWGVQWTLTTTYLWAKSMMDGRVSTSGANNHMSDYFSHLGYPGSIELNPKIEWRVWSDSNPQYLRVASHNNYRQGRWTYNYTKEGMDGFDDSYEKHFRKVVSVAGDERTFFRADDEEKVAKASNEELIEVRGTITHKEPVTVVPTVPGYFSVTQILGEETYAEINSMGSMHFINRGPVINYALLSDPAARVQDYGPIEGIDLEVPEEEKEVISELVAKLELRSKANPREMIETIRAYFDAEFEYSTQFDPGEVDDERSLIEWFLNDLKKGHCEYYATSTVLLLRELGIPARYTMGYAINERGSDCWNVRGTNAHAWARAFVDGNWIDVDLTPPDYRGVTTHPGINPVEWVREKIALLREDFFIWRQDPANRSAFLVRASVAVGLLLFWIIFRLWRHRSKDKLAVKRIARWRGEVVSTPLHKLERAIQARVGVRASGEPYGEWVRKLASLEGVDESLVEKVVALHQVMRFDPQARVSGDELKVLVRQLKQQTRK